MNAKIHLAVATASLLVSSLAGQGAAKVVPAWATTVDGRTSSLLPYVYNRMRVQHLIDGASFCTNTAVLFEFSYRIDGAITWRTSALVVSNLTVTIGSSPNSAKTMSNFFARNRTGTQTTIFTGNYNLPAQPVPTNGLGNFNVTYKFSRPYTYNRKTGNFLIEFVVPGVVSKTQGYHLDGAFTGPSITYRGTPGEFANKYRSYLWGNNIIATLVPGGFIHVWNRAMRIPYPTLHVYGFSNSQFGPFKLPLDLTPAGAPGNFLQNGMDFMFFATLTQVQGMWTATTKLPIPNNPVFGGATIHATNVCLDQSANNLGLVFGRGVSLTFGGGVSPGMNMIYAQSSSQVSGAFFNGPGKPGGPVIQLKGGFN